MTEYWTFSLTVFAAFFAIMNPIAAVPVFISLTSGADKKEEKIIAQKSTTVAFLIGLVFFLLGGYIFKMFGITIPAFKITGGFMLFYSGFEMLQSKKRSVKNLATATFDDNVAITPLAIPMLTGPGTIVTGMNFVTHSNSTHLLLVLAIFGLMTFLNYVAFRLSDLIIAKIGNNIISIIGKIMGLIIAIIGTNMVLEGIKTSFSL